MVQSMQEEAVQCQAGTGVWHVVPEALGETESEKELVQALHAYLATDQKRAAVVAQVGRLDRLMQSAMHEVQGVLQTVNVVEARRLDGVLRGIEDNTSSLHTTTTAAHHTATSVHVIQGLLLVSLVFNVIDRIGAGSLNVPAPNWVVALIKEPLMDPPLVRA